MPINFLLVISVSFLDQFQTSCLKQTWVYGQNSAVRKQKKRKGGEAAVLYRQVFLRAEEEMSYVIGETKKPNMQPFLIFDILDSEGKKLFQSW